MRAVSTFSCAPLELLITLSRLPTHRAVRALRRLNQGVRGDMMHRLCLRLWHSRTCAAGLGPEFLYLGRPFHRRPAAQRDRIKTCTLSPNGDVREMGISVFPPVRPGASDLAVSAPCSWSTGGGASWALCDPSQWKVCAELAFTLSAGHSVL